MIPARAGKLRAFQYSQSYTRSAARDGGVSFPSGCRVSVLRRLRSQTRVSPLATGPVACAFRVAPGLCSIALTSIHSIRDDDTPPTIAVTGGPRRSSRVLSAVFVKRGITSFARPPPAL